MVVFCEISGWGASERALKGRLEASNLLKLI